MQDAVHTHQLSSDWDTEDSKCILDALRQLCYQVKLTGMC